MSFERRLSAARQLAKEGLLGERNTSGWWDGELSSSALSTATAIVALHWAARVGTIQRHESKALISAGYRWLAANVNMDGGWGDTTRSLSNISTTALVWAAFGLEDAEGDPAMIRHAEEWLTQRAGSVEPTQLATAIIDRYGEDRTFSVPILTQLALCGRLGDGRAAWRHVIPLPFELAAAPRSWFAALNLPVVSYALPALIAIGLVRHDQAPSRWPWIRGIRAAVRRRCLRKLATIQPANGGFLEATPLTSFVLMSLCAAGEASGTVGRLAAQFVMASAREDGSWPIDTNLNTWVTTLSVNALSAERALEGAAAAPIREWLLSAQYQEVHPYTGAAPGAWAWTNLPGGVPDADDTAGAILALSKIAGDDPRGRAAAEFGILWLCDLQNSDGGVPTFCRGWGRLDFDRSCADITAHAMRAARAWEGRVSEIAQRRMERMIEKGDAFLERSQSAEGSWVPLWFGAQFRDDEANPLYGTSRVALALGDGRVRDKGVEWLVRTQNSDGSWGTSGRGPGSVEESSMVLEALTHVAISRPDDPALRRSIRRGAEWLVANVEMGTWREPEPIGFYFAKLWYFERLYPMIFSVAALEAMALLPLDYWRE